MAVRKPKLLEGQALIDYAARLLSGRAYSLGEMREKLRRKAQNARDVPAAIARLKELGYLNDERFAKEYATLRRDNEGVGKIRVIRALRARRVAAPVAEKAAGEAYRGSDETALIDSWLERKYRGKNLGEFLSVEKNLASAFRRLRTAGFSASNSIRVLRRYARAAEESLDALENESLGEETE
jgi:regulatory protein